MAKIVIIAPAGAEDVDDAVKLLKAAGHDVETEEPTPKSLLHIVLGLLGPNAYGFGSGYAYAPGPQADDDLPPEDEGSLDALADDELSAEEDIDIPGDESDDFSFESTTVDGELIDAVKVDGEQSVLVVEKMVVGPKTTYILNESTFSFWPADTVTPMQRVGVGYKKWHTSLEVLVVEGEKQELRVGKDLIPMFEIKGEFDDEYEPVMKANHWKKRGDHFHHPMHGTVKINKHGHWEHKPHGGNGDPDDGFEGSTAAGLDKHLKRLEA